MTQPRDSRGRFTSGGGSGGSGSGMNLGTAYGQIRIDASGVQSGIQQAQRSFNNGIQSMGQSIQSFGQQVQMLGANLTLLTAPLAAMQVQGIRTAASFQDSLTMIQARTGATAEAMDMVRETALQLGADTKFSAQQVSDAFLQLLTAGLSMEESLAALPQVLSAAAAGGLDLGTSADIVTNVMTSFGLTATDTTRIVQAMSAAAASSPASMLEIGQAMQQVGGVAQAYGITMDETAAIMAIFAQNGIRGSEAGTQLRSMLRNMTSDAAPTQEAWTKLGISMFDAEGNMRDLDMIMGEMNASLATMTEQERIEVLQQLGGAYGQIGLNALLGSDGVDAMTQQMAAQADVTSVAQTMMGTFNGAMESLRGSIETLMITAFTPFIEMLTPLINRVIEIVNGISDWVAANQAIVQPLLQVMTVVVALGPALFAVGTAISAFGGIISVIGVALGALLSPIGLIIAAVVGLGVAWTTNFMGIQETLQPVIDTISTFATTVIEHIKGIWTAFQEGGLVNVGTYITDNIINPLLSSIQNIDWSAVATTLVNGLGTAISTLGTWATWVYDNILLPLWNNFTTAIASVDWGSVGLSIINAIGMALQLSADFGAWVHDNILAPFVANTQTAIENVDWYSVGSGIVNAIGSILKTAFDFVAWIIDSIFSPVTDNADAATGEVDWSGVGTSILNAIGSFLQGAFDFIQWLMDNVLSPLILGAADAIGRLDWSSVGQNLMDSIRNALPNIAQWVTDNIITPIRNALANFNPMEAVNTGASNISTFFNQVGGALGWAEGGRVGYASGGMVNAVVGERGPENVALPVGSQVTPTSGSNMPSIGTMIIQANTEAGGAAAMRGALSEWDKVMSERNFQ